MDENEARQIMANGLGQAELEFVTSICAPLYWVVREPSGKLRVHNGTAFFLDVGNGPFAVTADHVLAGLEQDRICRDVVTVQLGRDLALDLNGEHAVLDKDAEVDIATFRISQTEISSLSKSILTGYQSTWPPAPPEKDKGIYFSGFAGRETRFLSEAEISFGATPGSGVADSVSNRDVTTLFDRRRWIDAMGHGLPPERYDFGGISGGPMLSVIERNGLRSWSLAGVIYEGPNTSTEGEQSIAGFETIRARRADFIMSNGSIDRSLWRWS